MFFMSINICLTKYRLAAEDSSNGLQKQVDQTFQQFALDSSEEESGEDLEGSSIKWLTDGECCWTLSITTVPSQDTDWKNLAHSKLNILQQMFRDYDIVWEKINHVFINYFILVYFVVHAIIFYMTVCQPKGTTAITNSCMIAFK